MSQAPSLQRTSYVAMRFHRRVWYRALSLCYARIRSSGIILTTYRLPLCKISFLSWPPLLKLAYGEKSRTQSISRSITQSPSLFDAPGTEAFASELICRGKSSTYQRSAMPTRRKSYVDASHFNFHNRIAGMLKVVSPSCNCWFIKKWSHSKNGTKEDTVTTDH